VIRVTGQSTNQWLFNKGLIYLMGQALLRTSVNRSSHRMADERAGKEGKAGDILVL